MGLGPHALLQAGLLARLEQQGIAARLVEIKADEPFPAEIATTFALQGKVRRAAEAAAKEGRLPISLAGNCNTAVIGSLAAQAGGELGLFWFDAHSDAETPESSTSGFLDGMGLAMVLGRCWRPMLASVGATPLDGSRAALVGAREVSEAAGALLRQCGVALVPPEQARSLSPDEALGGAVAQIKRNGVQRVHIHLDLDVLDRDVVGAANDYALPGGIDAAQLEALLKCVLETFELTSASIASYDPRLDRNGAIAAAALDAIALLAKRG
jgi:arginase